MSKQFTENLEHGDVVKLTERWKVVGFDGPDVLAMTVVDGEPQGSVHRWQNGFHGRPGVGVKVVD